ncbi:hypothetical protein [Arthrobacter alkaliphilus]|uniref:hypothetical protein n=1 Tax=Arthrobacter alkaliphilus TaxID=369936 RepID=UPI001F336798|nr:hypothetical protein [Arthrobacter alkaliphilus]
MAVSNFGRFLDEATIPNLDPTRRLGQEQLFGLYLSWCRLHDNVPASETDFRAAMKQHRIRSSDSGFWMTGPAATDYILSTYPVLP